jgi:predicted hotdog family 3-hydroxylacyl-ACP dehydratase
MYDLASLVPHRPPMLLLGRIVDVSQSTVIAEVNISTNTTFFILNRGVPAWVGIEYMAQAAAVLGGFQMCEKRTEQHSGYLVGTPKYTCSVAWFRAGDRLRVKCSCNIQSTAIFPLKHYHCEILIRQANIDKVIASARLSIYQRSQ